MGVPAPRLRRRLDEGERLLGVLLRLPSEDLLEMAAVSGFDFVLIDCEHGPADVVELRRHVTVAQLHGVDVLVRTGSDEPALVLRALDQGAAGVVAPHTDDPATATRLVDSVRYPPHGHRGFATYTRAGDFGRVPAAEHRERAAQALVIGMIESPDGVRAVDAVLDVPGLDGLMVGAADLAASRTGDDPPLQECLDTVHRAVAAHGALRMDIVLTPEQASASFGAGAQLVVYNTAEVLMRHLAQLAAVRPR
ncbi:HpcH/HpaI aldolase family protein [Auraticoccus monumenti]|uniref:4-hydroxy-2-oxoheptanedioate aldolase n=1 Tax=Auraticoccus monumenti TaxID=675864 RepID=A0A1G6S5S2_9ACTN|nr:aldolase/citrate lyase family protein [Auraticoccus monumenti]SDD12024.1 4-hydroxy-2-oxoheptanedioate aldolase [Auraticoccus monumenti]